MSETNLEYKKAMSRLEEMHNAELPNYEKLYSAAKNA